MSLAAGKTGHSSADAVGRWDRPSFVADSSTGSFVGFGRSTAAAGRTAAGCTGLIAGIAATGHRSLWRAAGLTVVATAAAVTGQKCPGRRRVAARQETWY